MASRPFAAFDIDGTVIRWQLYHAIADDMAKRGLLDKSEYKKVREARMQWKKRIHEKSYREYEDQLVEVIDSAITSIKADDFLDACSRVLDEYKDQVYTFTRDLIEDLKKEGYLLFAISASQREIVGMMAGYYGFDDYGGSTYEIKNGRFTGHKNILRSGQKPLFLEELIQKHAATMAGSIAVGDSESDIPMLSAVEQPIAFNPTKELFEHATSNNWQVVVERKNMTYRLEPNDGSYRLLA